MTLVEQELRRRRDQLTEIRAVFRAMHPELPLRIRRGRVQTEVFEALGVNRDAKGCELVSEALRELGYQKVKICGTFFYRRKGGP